MCAPSLFDADFCTVASGWEKGGVEKNGQDSGRRIGLDAQSRQFGSFAELNAGLGERCRAVGSELRPPEYKEFSVAEMLDQERAERQPMPTPFDGYGENLARVSCPCRVSVQRNRYSVPGELAGQRVSTGSIRIGSAWWQQTQHSIPWLERKPGALRNGAPFADMPVSLKQLKLGLMRHAGED